jgi:hypothetical protein
MGDVQLKITLTTLLTWRPVNSNLYESLARLFEQLLPYVKSVYSYICAMRLLLRFARLDVEWRDGCFGNIGMVPRSLRGKRLQVSCHFRILATAPDSLSRYHFSRSLQKLLTTNSNQANDMKVYGTWRA